MIILMVFMVFIRTMLIIIIISQMLGHTNFNKSTQQINNMSLISMNKVEINPLVILGEPSNEIFGILSQPGRPPSPLTKSWDSWDKIPNIFKNFI